jgi:DNA-directed RNA polymerase specialized sigma24 family protein
VAKILLTFLMELLLRGSPALSERLFGPRVVCAGETDAARGGMLVDERQTHQSLRRIVGRIAANATLQEDLMQEALLHLWQQEIQRPDQKLSWYLQGCRFHLNNYISRGRSVDSAKRRSTTAAGSMNGSDMEALLDESEFGGAAFAAVCARDMVAQLSNWMPPIERQIVGYLADGLTIREIAGRLDVSHTAVIKHRRKIAVLAIKLGIIPPPNRLEDHARLRTAKFLSTLGREPVERLALPQRFRGDNSRKQAMQKERQP